MTVSRWEPFCAQNDAGIAHWAVTLAAFKMGHMHRLIASHMRVAFLTPAVWLVGQQAASAQTLLAQTGTAKTAVGWAIVALCVGLGLLVVCRPSVRNPLKPKKAKKKNK